MFFCFLSRFFFFSSSSVFSISPSWLLLLMVPQLTRVRRRRGLSKAFWGWVSTTSFFLHPMGDLDIKTKTPKNLLYPGEQKNRCREPIVNPSFSFLTIPSVIRRGRAKTRKRGVLLICTVVHSESQLDANRLECSLWTFLKTSCTRLSIKTIDGSLSFFAIFFSLGS